MSKISDQRPHRGVFMYLEEVKSGKMSRREFLERSTALGISAALAYNMLGATPATAAEPKMGGAIRVEMPIKAQKDPRTFDWPEMSNVTRGWLEYLVEYQRDGRFEGVLLESWEANADASAYVLKIRRGITWQNGDPFTAEDVARNITNWADSTVEGNSMASRMSALADEETGKARAGAIEVVDPHTVRLTLSRPDISIIASFSEYPAAVTHKSHAGGDPTVTPIGTGPYTLESFETGVKAVLVRAEGHNWWRGEAPLDRIEYIDISGGEPAAVAAAVEGGEVDLVYETTGEFISVLDAVGWTKSEAITAASIVVRPNQSGSVDQNPFADVRVRRAIQMAVDNAVVLELGYSSRGSVAENHHVSPLHPEYADVQPVTHDKEAAKALLDETGFADYPFELTSLDSGWVKDTADAVAAQLRQAGFNISRKVLPGNAFWNDWTKYPFSSTAWGHRPLGVQVLNLAYRSGVAWNETGFANAEFDQTLDRAMSILDADERRKHMKKLQQIMLDEGVTIQPYWRAIYNHSAPHVRNADMHPTFEIRPHEIWLDT